jgi:hypothetical protein
VTGLGRLLAFSDATPDIHSNRCPDSKLRGLRADAHDYESSLQKTKADLLKAMEGHILAQAELMGNYERVKK